MDYDFPFSSLAVVDVPVENQVTVAQLSNVFKVGTDHTFRLNGEYRINENNIFPQDLGTNSEVRYEVYTTSALWSWDINDSVTFSNAVRYDKLRLNRKGPTATPDDDASLNYTNSDFDKTIEELSINAGLVVKATDNDTFRATYARGVDLPSIAEFGLQFPTLVGPPFGVSRWFLGNPDIDVSIVNNYELNWQHEFYEYNSTLQVAAFYQTASDMQSLDDFAKDVDLTSAPPSFNDTTPFRNHLDADVVGGEIEYSGTYDTNWRYSASYSLAVVTEDLLDTKAPAGVADEDPINRYEGRNGEHKVNLNLGYEGDNYTIDGYAYYTSGFVQDRNDVDNDIDDNLILSLRGNYDITDKLSASVTAIGLQDDNWQESMAMEAERQIFFSVKYKLN